MSINSVIQVFLLNQIQKGKIRSYMSKQLGRHQVRILTSINPDQRWFWFQIRSCFWQQYRYRGKKSVHVLLYQPLIGAYFLHITFCKYNLSAYQGRIRAYLKLSPCIMSSIFSSKFVSQDFVLSVTVHQARLQ